MTRHIERRRECDAMQVTAETNAAVVSWCGPGGAMAMPDGSLLLKMGDVWLTVPVGSYIKRDGSTYTIHGAAEFEAQWAPAEGQ